MHRAWIVEFDPGDHFTNNFSNTIQMWWKFDFALFQILKKWLLQNLAHGMTAGLLWHVLNFVAIWSPVIELRAKWNFHRIWIVMEKSLLKQIGRFRTVTPVWFTNGYEMMHKAWSSIEEVPYCFSRSSVKFEGHTAIKIVDFDPDWVFRDCISSLKSPMATKWCTKLEVE